MSDITNDAEQPIARVPLLNRKNKRFLKRKPDIGYDDHEKSIKGDNTKKIADFADRICATWQNPVQSIMKVGRLLIQAKEELRHGEWTTMVEEKLPFSIRTAQKLMKIAQHPVLSKATHESCLPPSWSTIYALIDLLPDLPDETFEVLIADGTINPNLERKDVEQIGKDLREGGIYRFNELRNSLDQCVHFMNHWPDPKSLGDHLFGSRPVKCSGEELAALPAWIGKLHELYLDYQRKADESEREWQEEREQRRADEIEAERKEREREEYEDDVE
jgi:hypothetical protein